MNLIANQKQADGPSAHLQQEESGTAINIDSISNFSEDGPGNGNGLDETSTDSIGQF